MLKRYHLFTSVNDFVEVENRSNGAHFYIIRMAGLGACSTGINVATFHKKLLTGLFDFVFRSIFQEHVHSFADNENHHAVAFCLSGNAQPEGIPYGFSITGADYNAEPRRAGFVESCNIFASGKQLSETALGEKQT